MVYTFFPDVIKGKEYNNLVNYLCNVADKIYFMFYEDMMYNDRILELEQNCKKINVPRRIREHMNEGMNIIGYEMDIFITMYIFEYNSFYDLLRDTPYGVVLFYSGDDRIIYVHLNDFDDIYITTDDRKLIKELSYIENLNN